MTGTNFYLNYAKTANFSNTCGLQNFEIAPKTCFGKFQVLACLGILDMAIWNWYILEGKVHVKRSFLFPKYLQKKNIFFL